MNISPALPVAATPVVQPRATTIPAAGRNSGSSVGGGPIGDIFNRLTSRHTLLFALGGAIAACFIPPLAFLGGPIGGAVAGAALAQLI